MVLTTWGSKLGSSNKGLPDLWALIAPNGWTRTEQTASRTTPRNKSSQCVVSTSLQTGTWRRLLWFHF